MSKVIYIATDHAGLRHKDLVKEWLSGEGFEVKDCGAFVRNDEDDFTDFISQAAEAVSEDPDNRRAIVFGGSGQGEAMLANRYQGVRAAVYYGGSEDIVRLSREHNNANVLSIGARFVDINTTKAMIWTWLHTEQLPAQKYQRRIGKIASITKKLSNFLAQDV